MIRADGGASDLSEDRAPAILIVEDEFQIRLALGAYLRDCGFKILMRATADEAITMLERNQDTIDLIFSDIRMPGTMDGLGLARWAHQYRPGLPVFLTTGDADLVNAGYTLGAAQTIFAKPYDMDVVVSKIREALGCHQIWRALIDRNPQHDR